MFKEELRAALSGQVLPDDWMAAANVMKICACSKSLDLREW